MRRGLAVHDGTAWQVEVVDTVAQWRAVVAIDPSGQPAISYGDSIANVLKFARK